MTINHKPHGRPSIQIRETDAERIGNLAMDVMGRQPQVAELLLDEINRAKVVQDSRLPVEIVAMQSTVRFVDEAGPVRFVDTEAAARYLALEAHTLECYRSRGGGPAYHKFGKWVRYAVDDLDAWAKSCRRTTTVSPEPPRILPIDRI